MKKLSDYIKELKPAELAKLRKKRTTDSSRDKESLLKRTKKLETALSEQGNIVFFSDIQYLEFLSGGKEIKFGAVGLPFTWFTRLIVSILLIAALVQLLLSCE
jgi:hypothetical protein